MMKRRALAAFSAGILAMPPVLAQVPGTGRPAHPVAGVTDLPYRPIEVRAPDGTRLAAQEWGNRSGPEILFVHGVLQSHLSFAKQVRGRLPASSASSPSTSGVMAPPASRRGPRRILMAAPGQTTCGR